MVMGQFTASEVGNASVHLGTKSAPGSQEFAPRLPWRRHRGVA
jgi:hypothetical protein